MTSGYPREAMLAFLERAHARGQELYLVRGELRVVGRVDQTLATALRLLAPQLRAELRPFTCPWCDGAAELPDGCSACWLALHRYAKAAAHFGVGPRVAHAFHADVLTLTACGLTWVGRDLPPLPLGFVRPGALCRNCLAALKREHRAASLRPRGHG